MTFAEIAFKNIQKKFSSYLVYFFSTAFSVVIFYTFCSMYYDPTFEAYRFGTGKMTVLFRGSAAATLLFAAVFVLYSGSYFIKTQKKEIAIYALLGMRKGKIALMMFLETFLIGLLAVALGTLIGTFSAGYLTSLLMRFMAVGTAVTLSAEPRAMLVTMAAFAALFMLSGMKAYKAIYQYTLIDLLSASKQSERVPGFSPAGALASLMLLAVGYTTAAVMNLNAGGIQLLLPAFMVIISVSAGTYLLFRNFAPLAVAVFKRNRPLYYHTSNFISVSQIAFRLKSASKMLSVAALLCAVTITMVSASYSLYRGLEDAVSFYAPYSYLAKGVTDEQHSLILKAAADINEVAIVYDDEITLCHVQIQSDRYAVQEGKERGGMLGELTDAYLLSESQYLDIISHTQAQTGDYVNIKTSFTGGLSDRECFFLDGNVTSDYCKPLVGQPLNVRMEGKTAQYTVKGAALHKYIGLLDLYQRPTLIVSDPEYQRYISAAGANGVTTYRGLIFDDNMASGNTVAAMDAMIPARFTSGGLPGNISYIEMYRLNFSLYGSYVFIGLFIGVLFMLAVGSVLYYKLIIEAQEEAPRFAILRKIGITKREIRASVAKQIGLVYGMPLGVGLVHTVFALLTYNRMMEEIGQETPTLQNALMVTLIFIVVYGAFYGLSVRNYNSIVWKQANGDVE